VSELRLGNLQKVTYTEAGTFIEIKVRNDFKITDQDEETMLKMSLPSYQGDGHYKILFSDLVEFSIREEDIINRLSLRKLL